MYVRLYFTLAYSYFKKQQSFRKNDFFVGWKGKTKTKKHKHKQTNPVKEKHKQSKKRKHKQAQT